MQFALIPFNVIPLTHSRVMMMMMAGSSFLLSLPPIHQSSTEIIQASGSLLEFFISCLVSCLVSLHFILSLSSLFHTHTTTTFFEEHYKQISKMLCT